MSDDELMKLVQSGSVEAFNTLVATYQTLLIGFFMRRTGDVQLSEDLTQETLLKVHSQAWDYLPLGRFRGWMFRIARNLLIDTHRKRSHDALVQAIRCKPQEEQDSMARLAGEVFGPDEQVEEQEFKDLVKELLAEIPDDQRETFEMHHFEGLSLPDVAAAMEVTTATSKSRLRLAREKLAEKLRSRGIGPAVLIPGE